VRFFDQMKIALGITKKDCLLNLNEDFRSGKRKVPKWEFDSIDPAALMNLDKIATKP